MTALSEEYAKQPYPLTTIKGDLTMSQTKILVGMNETLRERIGELMKNKKDGMKLFNQADLDENGNIVVDVPLSNLTSRPDEYRDIEKVAPLLINAKTQIDRGDSIEYFNAFTSIIVPKTRGKEGRRTGVVRIVMSQYQANTLFDFTRFTQFLPLVANTSKSVYTSRIYMLLASERWKGRWKVNYQELRNILGCNTYDKDTKEWKRAKYEIYKNFKYRVLATAEKELKEFADENKSDLYFTYNEVYEGKGNLRTDPIAIEFTIITTAKGREADNKAKNTIRYIAYQDFMIEQFGFSKKDCQQILGKVDDDIAEQFGVRMEEISSAMNKQGNKINDRRLYALKCLHDAVDEFTPIMDAEGDAKAEGQKSKVEPEGNTSRTEVKMSVGAMKDRWAKVVGAKMYKMYLHSTTMNIRDGKVVIDYPHEEVREFVKEHKKELEKSCGLEIML